MKVNSPLLDAQMDEQTRIYVAVLERQVLGLTLTVSKYRAVLGAVIGEDQPDVLVDLEEKELKAMAVEAVQKKMDVSASQARKIVDEREAAAEASDLPA